MSERTLVWTEDRCAGCGRPAYQRKDGRTYLYRYGNDRVVCSVRCSHTYEVTGAGVDTDGWYKYSVRRSDGKEMQITPARLAELRRAGRIVESAEAA